MRSSGLPSRQITCTERPREKTGLRISLPTSFGKESVSPMRTRMAFSVGRSWSAFIISPPSVKISSA
jgi:hypothetical protein